MPLKGETRMQINQEKVIEILNFCVESGMHEGEILLGLLQAKQVGLTPGEFIGYKEYCIEQGYFEAYHKTYRGIIAQGLTTTAINMMSRK